MNDFKFIGLCKNLIPFLKEREEQLTRELDPANKVLEVKDWDYELEAKEQAEWERLMRDPDYEEADFTGVTNEDR